MGEIDADMNGMIAVGFTKTPLFIVATTPPMHAMASATAVRQSAASVGVGVQMGMSGGCVVAMNRESLAIETSHILRMNPVTSLVPVSHVELEI